MSETKGNGKVFISHAHEDNELCRPLLQALDEWHIDYWFDGRNLQPGENILDVINRELDDRDIYLRICTSAAARSPWVREEFSAYHALLMEDSRENAQSSRTLINIVMDSAFKLTPIDKTKKYITTVGREDREWLAELRQALADVSRPPVTDPVSNKERYRQFFTHVAADLAKSRGWAVPTKIGDRNWCSFSTGVPGFAYSTSFPSGGKVRTELYIGAEQAKAVFAKLLEDKVAIEQEFGGPLTWEPLEYRKASRIAAYRPGSIQDDAKALEQHQAWVVDHLMRFKKVFGPRLAQVSQVVPVEVAVPGE